MKSNRTRYRHTARIAFFLMMLMSFFLVLFTMPRIAVPFVIAYVIYLVLDPMIPALMKLGVKRNIAILILFFGLILIVTLPVVKVVPNLTEDAQKIQSYIPRVEEYVQSKYSELADIVYLKTGYQVGNQSLNNVVEYAKTASANFLMNLPDLVGSVLEWMFVAPLFLFFMMRDGRNFKKTILGFAPNSIFERFYFLAHEFKKKIGDYIFAKIIEAGIIQVVITIGLLIMDVRFSFLFGLVAGVTNIIPYLGPVLGMVPAVVYGVVEYGPTATLWGIIILFLIANIIDMALIFPIMVSKIVDLHPIVVVLAVILGSQSLGTVGMVISIPVAVAIKLVLGQIFRELYAIEDRS